MWDGPAGEGLSRAHIIRACDDSLKRLGTDRIDLYQSHWPDDATPIEETLAAYADLIRAGKIRYIGASNFSPARLAEALALAAGSGLPLYVCDQPYYNLLSRGDEDDRAWILRKYKVGCIPYTPLAQGFLTGKYSPTGPLPKSQRAEHVKRTYFSEKNWKILDLLKRLGRKRGKTIAQMALGWLLTHDWVTAPILGSSDVRQLKEDLGAAGLRLSPEEMKSIDEASNAS
jgi:aryl-alcohol dehydrogenase-like predicted oxidoreductase